MHPKTLATSAAIAALCLAVAGCSASSPTATPAKTATRAAAPAPSDTPAAHQGGPCDAVTSWDPMLTGTGMAVLTDETGFVSAQVTITGGTVKTHALTISAADSPYSIEMPMVPAAAVTSVALYFETDGASTWCVVPRG